MADTITTLLSVEQKQHLGRIAAKLFLDITQRWGLSDNQKAVLAGAATRTTISTWRQRVLQKQSLQLGNDTYERIDCIYEIDRLLEQLSCQEACSLRTFLQRPQLALFDESPLSTMLNGKVIDLYTTLRFLQTARVFSH